MVNQMTTSVAMCTYNGARFIEEQLRSIITQTMPVGEIVVCDDRSTDNTTEIIQTIAQETNIPIHIHINEPSLGCVRNFEKAIRLCQGDIIFLSDQDDIWKKNKVEVVCEYFNNHSNKTVLISNANLIDEQGECFTDVTLFDVVGLNEQLRYFDMGLATELLLQSNRATGCTMALRKGFIPDMHINLDATPNSGMQIHDGCIAMSAALNNALGYIREPLTLYRQHLSQTCGLGWWINSPKHYPSPLIPKGYYDTSFGISHIRIEMQYLRGRKYTRYGSIIMHINKYYRAYGSELMWKFIKYDFYLKMLPVIKVAYRIGKFFLKPFFEQREC